MTTAADWLPDAPLLTVTEVSRVLRVSERALRGWLYLRREGQPVIPHVRLGRRVFIRREWVEAILDGNAQPPGQPPGGC